MEMEPVLRLCRSASETFDHRYEALILSLSSLFAPCASSLSRQFSGFTQSGLLFHSLLYLVR